MTRTARILTTITLALGVSALAGASTTPRPGDGNAPIRESAAPVLVNQVKTVDKTYTSWAGYIRG